MIASYMLRPSSPDRGLPETVDYFKIRNHNSFYYPTHQDQRHFEEKNIFLNEKNERCSYGKEWHEGLGDLTYRVNKDGWHGTEFVERPSLLCAGCSVTAGYGLKHQETWPHLLAKHLGKSVNVVGWPGGSISQIVYLVLSHIERFGLPEQIHLSLPDITRGWTQINRSGRVEDTTVWYNHETATFHTHAGYARLDQFKVESLDGTRRPLSLTSVVRENLNSIDIISMFAKINNIDLFISTHRSSTHVVLGREDNEYPNYVFRLDHLDSKSEAAIGDSFGCCDIEQESPRWVYAADNSHPGMHAHIHIAEMHAKEKIR